MTAVASKPKSDAIDIGNNLVFLLNNLRVFVSFCSCSSQQFCQFL